MWFNLKIIHHKGKLEFKENEGSQASLVFGIYFRDIYSEHVSCVCDISVFHTSFSNVLLLK